MSIIIDWYMVGIMFLGASSLSAGLMTHAIVKETNERNKFLKIFIVCIIMSLILRFITK